MKVLFDARPVRTPVSGVARYCIGLGRQLADELSPNDTVHYFCQNWKGRNNEIYEMRGVGNLLTPDSLPPFVQNVVFEFLPNYADKIIGEKFDVVHETYFGRLGRCAGRRKVVTIHDVIPLEIPELFNAKNRYFSRKNFMRQCREADHIIFISEYTKCKAIEYCGKIGAHSVIPCGVDPFDGALNDSFLEKHNLHRDGFVLYIGNIEPRKNLVAFSKAFSILRGTSAEKKFVVAGHLNYKARAIVDAMASLLGRRFVYLGRVSEQEKWTLLDNASLFVFPSFYEGFGIPIVEAYVAKCPAIFADNSSMTGLAVSEEQMFRATDTRDIFEKLDNVLRNEVLLKDLVERCSAKANLYRWDSIAMRVADVYRRVLR